jgi:hypothetical protein
MNQHLPRQDNQKATRMKTNEIWPCKEQRERFLADKDATYTGLGSDMTFGGCFGVVGQGLDMTEGTTERHKELGQASIASPWRSVEQMSKEAENDDASPDARL